MNHRVDYLLLRENFKQSRGYSYHSHFDEIFSFLDSIQRPIQQLSEYDLHQFLLKFKDRATSVETIRQLETRFRTVYEFLCNSIDFNPGRRLCAPEDLFNYIDIDGLLSVTVNPEQYNTIKNQILQTIDGKTYNYRDKLAVILAWNGLSTHQIVNLKKDSIIKNSDGTLFIDVTEDEHRDTIPGLKGITIISDDELEETIEIALKEKEYVTYHSDGSPCINTLKQTNYLIDRIFILVGGNLEMIKLQIFQRK